MPRNPEISVPAIQAERVRARVDASRPGDVRGFTPVIDVFSPGGSPKCGTGKCLCHDKCKRG